MLWWHWPNFYPLEQFHPLIQQHTVYHTSSHSDNLSLGLPQLSPLSPLSPITSSSILRPKSSTALIALNMPCPSTWFAGSLLDLALLLVSSYLSTLISHCTTMHGFHPASTILNSFKWLHPFCLASAYAWNIFPGHQQDTTSLASFKSLLKIHIFHESFCTTL